MSGNILLQKVCVSFGEKKVLQDLDAAFPLGGCSVIMGPSGCGKTTLLRLLLGLERPRSGKISPLPGPASAVFQEDRLLEMLTPGENISAVLGRKVHPSLAAQTLERLGLGASMDKPVGTMSGGMKRRVSIALALLAPHELLLLDEPFQGLDRETKIQVIQVILENEKNRTIVAATHDPEDSLLMNASCLLRMEQL